MRGTYRDLSFITVGAKAEFLATNKADILGFCVQLKFNTLVELAVMHFSPLLQALDCSPRVWDIWLASQVRLDKDREDAKCDQNRLQSYESQTLVGSLG
jgi:hypothetical protein